ncbi:MAG: aminotransferase class I/II-fold pyridoxal phosphate-dependent enzyme [Thermoplasmata archaeon]|nr:aminotransferase class I/II-fold pyridoxal phosphate-dependent enzyme [Thermoplasmata archaeon]
MKFPLADWIDSHPECRYNLGASGMHGTVHHPLPTRAEVRSATEKELRRHLAELVGVSPSRLFLTHGATESNAEAVTYLSRRRGEVRARCRVQFPEYPPLFDLARSAGYRLVTSSGRTALAIVSQPRNPIGNLWSGEVLAEWARDARAIVVDETFREFTSAASVQRLALPGLWSTGSFTKAYGADDLRVGFIVPPEDEQDRFAHFHGLVVDELPNYSVAGALATLADRDRILGQVRSVMARNQELWRRATPSGPTLAAPVAFDDPVPSGGDRFTRKCLRASVLVCPGSLFGRPSGVRVCLTRRSFPRDLRAYVRVRDLSP